MLACDAFKAGGGTWGATNDTANSAWSAYFGVPLPETAANVAASFYRANFFRVLMTEKKVAICDPSTCEYGAWSPTFTAQPNYHVSTYLGVLHLVRDE